MRKNHLTSLRSNMFKKTFLLCFMLTGFYYIGLSSFQGQPSMEEIEQLQAEFNKMSPEEQQRILEEQQRFYEQELSKLPPEERKRIEEYQQFQEEVAKEFGKLSPEEQEALITKAQEIQKAIDEEIGAEKLATMSFEELEKWIEGRFGNDTSNPQPESNQEQVAPAAPVQESVADATQASSNVTAQLKVITKHTESLLLKCNNMPDLPGKVERWVTKGTLRNWDKSTQYSGMRNTIEKLNQYFQTLLTETGEAWYGKYLNTNAAILDILGTLEKNLVVSEPLIEANTFGMKKIGAQSKKSLIAILDTFGDILNNKKLIDALLTAVEPYEPEAKKMRQLAADIQKKSEGAIRRSSPSGTVRTGTSDFGGYGSNQLSSGGYPSYGGGNAYYQPQYSGYNAASPSYGGDSYTRPSSGTQKEQSDNTKPAATTAPGEKKETQEKKNSATKADTTALDKKMVIIEEIFQKFQQLTISIPPSLTDSTQQWFINEKIPSDVEIEFVKKNLPEIITFMKEKLAPAIKTIKGDIQRSATPKEYQKKLQKMFSNVTQSIKKINDSLCDLETNYKKYKEQLKSYAYLFLRIGKNNDTEAKKYADLSVSLYDLQYQYSFIEDEINTLVLEKKK